MQDLERDLATTDIRVPRKKSGHSEDPTPETRRLTAVEIFQAASESARDELRRSNQKLAFSGVAGGLTMGLTGLGVASMRALLGHEGQHIAPYLLYPIRTVDTFEPNGNSFGSRLHCFQVRDYRGRILLAHSKLWHRRTKITAAPNSRRQQRHHFRVRPR